MQNNKINKLILDIYSAAQNETIIGFNDYLVEQLKNFVKFDSAVFAGLDISSIDEYCIKSLYLHNQPIEKYSDRNYWEKDEPDPMLVKAYLNANKSVSGDLASVLKDNKAMLAYSKKYEVEQSLTICIPGEQVKHFGVGALWRSSNKEFQEMDRKLCEIILPHAFQAIEINYRFQGMKIGLGKSESANIFANFNGNVLFIDDAAGFLVGEEWPEWRPSILPAILLNKLVSDKSYLYIGNKIDVKASVHDELLFLRVKKKNAGYNLTKREVECINMVRAGKTSWQIGEILGVSERTANFHITNAVQKIGAKTRRDAVEKAISLGLLDG
jgi:DNA-binding CsgD family transcriptional regulator